MVLRTSIGGKRARVKLANAFNGTPVEIGAAHIAIRDRDSGIVAGSDRALTFGGRQSIKMAPGMVVISDPVDLTIAPLTDLAVSLYFPGDTGTPTTHATGLRPTYVSGEGNFAASATIPDATRRMSYYWLAAVEVDAPAGTPLIVAFGDSITDGARSTPDTHNTWPAILATRLAADKATAHMAIVNQGIGGNRVLSDGAGLAGVSALARLDRDVLSQPGIQWLMMLEGVNDIGNATAQTRQLRTDHRRGVDLGTAAGSRSRAPTTGSRSWAARSSPTKAPPTSARRAKPSASESTTGFAPPASTTPSSTSTPRRVTPPIRGVCVPSSIPAITCTRTTPDTGRWPRPSI